LVDDQCVAVSAGAGSGTAFDPGALVDRVALSRVVALGVEVEGGRQAGGRWRGYVHGHAVPLRERAEVGMRVGVLAHVALPGRVVWVYGQRRHIGIEDVVGGE